MKKWISCFLIVVFLIPNLQVVQAAETGTTISSGRITADTIWTKERSPYKVTNGFGLADGVTLTIEKGVTVLFSKNTGFSAHNGKLIVNGSESEKVIFDFEDTSDGKEMYNEEISLGSNSQLNNIEIHHARRALVIDGDNNQIKNALISENDFYGIYLSGKNNRIKDSNLLNNQNGIYFFGNDNILIGNKINASIETAIDLNSTNNIFINNTITQSGSYGLLSDIPYNSMINRFYYNTFSGNKNGILTGTANILHENNLLDSVNIRQSDVYTMDLSENYWGTTDSQRIVKPSNYYDIKIDPIKPVNVGVLEKTEPALPSLNSIKDNDSVITGKADPGDKITVTQKYSYWTSVKEYVADKNGLFQVEFSKVPAGEKIEAYATNQYGINSSIVSTNVLQGTNPEVPVVDEDNNNTVIKGPGEPEVDPITSNSTSITGVTEAGVTVYLYRPGRYLLAQTTAGDDGHFHFEISAQPVGTQYILDVVDLNGNRSAEKIVKVELPTPVMEPFTDAMTLLKGKTEPNALVWVNVENTTGGEVNSDPNGNFQFTLGRQKAGATIKITVFKNGFSIEKNLIVQDVIPPNPPNVDQITEKSTKVTGVAERFSTISVKNNGVEIASGTVNNAMEFTIDIPVQKAGTILEVDATDLAGNRSAVTRKVVASVPPKAPEVSLVTNKASAITGKADAGVTIIVLIGGSKYIGKADAKGLFKIIIPVQNAGTRISVTAKISASKVSQPAVAKVTRAVPNMPSVNLVRVYSTAITGKTDSFASVIVKIGTKTYTAKANKFGDFKVYIPKQRKGTKVSIYAKDSKGQTSAIKTIIILYL